MKKIFSVLLAVIMLLSMSITVFADEPEKMFYETAMSQLTDEELSTLKDTAKYHSSMEGKKIENQTIIKIYEGCFWEYSEKGVDSLLQYTASSDKRLNEMYVVLDKEPYCAYIFNEGLVVMSDVIKPSAFESFIKDFPTISQDVVIDGKQHKISEVHCFIYKMRYTEVALYLKTDSGTFVRYYENRDAEPKIFTDADFSKFSADYNDYLVSIYDPDHNESGELVGGSSEGSSLGEYLRTRGTVTSITMTNYEGKNFSFAIPVAIAAALIGITATVILIKKRKSVQKSS